jgi:transcriptional regulator with XRE-family HTH domain
MNDLLLEMRTPLSTQIGPMAGVRGYLRRLRQERHVSQKDLAEHIGLSRRALIDWETGKTRTIKSEPLYQAVEYLDGSADQINELLGQLEVTEADGESAALNWLRRDQIVYMDEIIATTSPDDLAEIIAELRNEYQRDSSLVETLRTFLAGWRARGAGHRGR